MSSNEVPEPWATRMTERGFTRRDGGPNVSALARAMGVSVETARRAVKGIGTPEPETVSALMDQLGSDVQDWTGQTVAAGPYMPPRESALLTGPQRDALTDLIRAIAAGQRQKAGGRDAKSNTAPMNGPDPAATPDGQAEYGLAAMAGEPGNPPDTTTGEESQVPPEGND